MMNKSLRILSIDAWREPEGGWTWNQWFGAGTMDRDTFHKVADNSRKLFRWFRDAGMLSDGSKGRVACEDDGYNIVIVNKATREPLFAIEYGGHGA